LGDIGRSTWRKIDEAKANAPSTGLSGVQRVARDKALKERQKTARREEWERRSKAAGISGTSIPPFVETIDDALSATDASIDATTDTSTPATISPTAATTTDTNSESKQLSSSEPYCLAVKPYELLDFCEMFLRGHGGAVDLLVQDNESLASLTYYTSPQWLLLR
jgi:hypothetical protein